MHLSPEKQSITQTFKNSTKSQACMRISENKYRVEETFS